MQIWNCNFFEKPYNPHVWELQTWLQRLQNLKILKFTWGTLRIILITSVSEQTEHQPTFSFSATMHLNPTVSHFPAANQWASDWNNRMAWAYWHTVLNHKMTISKSLLVSYSLLFIKGTQLDSFTFLLQESEVCWRISITQLTRQYHYYQSSSISYFLLPKWLQWQLVVKQFRKGPWALTYFSRNVCSCCCAQAK